MAPSNKLVVLSDLGPRSKFNMEAKIIEKFTPTLVRAIYGCVPSVAHECMAKGLIPSRIYDDIILGSSAVTGMDNAGKLLNAVKHCIEIDSILSFEIFLGILEKELPERSRTKLLTDMKTELAREQGQATPAINESTALMPAFNTGHEAMAPMHHGQLLLPRRSHEISDVSRLLHQEQNPFIGKLEESTREHERTTAEKKLLEAKLEENERLKAQLANMQSLLSVTNASESQSTTAGTSISEADILQLKEKIEKLEKKSEDLGMEIIRYRYAIDMQGEKITQKLMAEQKKQYEQMFQEFTRSMMNTRKFEREHGSYYELYPEEGSSMEPKREPQQHYGSSDSREGSDYDVLISKQKMTAESSSDTMADDGENVVHCKFEKVMQWNLKYPI